MMTEVIQTAAPTAERTEFWYVGPWKFASLDEALLAQADMLTWPRVPAHATKIMRRVQTVTIGEAAPPSGCDHSISSSCFRCGLTV